MKRHFLLWSGYLIVTGLTAGLVAFLLTEAIHLIQTLSFGFSQGSFSTMIASVPQNGAFCPYSWLDFLQDLDGIY